MQKRLLQTTKRVVPQSLRRVILRYVLPFAISQRLQRYGRVRVKRQRHLRGADTRALESKLWGGFSERALRDLESLKTHPDSNVKDIARAALALGSWYANQGDFYRAYQNAVLARVAYPALANTRRQLLLEAHSLLMLGERERTRVILTSAMQKLPEEPGVQLCMANTYARVEGPGSEDDDAIRLQLINRLFTSSNLAPLQKLDLRRPLVLDNLHAPSAQAAIPPSEQPKVTVLIPAYAAQATLHIALNGLLNQTWKQLEIIIIDDRSPDRTFEIAREYARRDERVVALQMEENGGSYASRNFGLRHATGAFVTVHDADDWSHPQKIEVQARHLMQHQQFPANKTECIRSYKHLFFSSSGRSSQRWVIANHSSLMLRREVLDQLGGWDEVRISADNELIRRLAHGYEDSHPILYAGTPLSFVLDTPDSLTKRGRTHLNTLIHGVRRNYHEAAKFWLAQQEPGIHALPDPSTGRAFPAPGFILRHRNELGFDLVFIADLNLKDQAYFTTMNYLHAALRAGLRVGVFHWPRYDSDVTQPPHTAVRQLAQEGRIHILSPGESATAETVIVGSPVVLQDAIDLPPAIRFKHFVVIADQVSVRSASPDHLHYDPREISANVEKVFGKRPSWAPVSELARQLMAQDARYTPIHDGIWTPLVDAETWCATAPSWRGKRRAIPRIGCHVHEQSSGWHDQSMIIREAYCADKPCEVYVLAYSDVFINGSEEKPANWRAHILDIAKARGLLGELDFFACYPNQGQVDVFDSAVLQAMALGVPVILPPGLRSVFGDAAIYAEPRAVWDVIQRLWSDEQAWLSSAEAGMHFVRQRCDWGQLVARLERLPATVATPALKALPDP